MILKKYSHILLLSLLAVFLNACGDDEDQKHESIIPEITLDNPTEQQINTGHQAGGNIILAGVVSDDTGLKSITITIGDESDNHWYSETMTDINADIFQLDTLISIPEDISSGDYIVSLSAVDIYNNVNTLNFILPIREPNAYFTVIVPTETPETAEVYLVGSFTPFGWDSNDTDDTYRLSRNSEGNYTGNFLLPEGDEQQFKFRIKSDDPDNPNKYIEMNMDCEDTEVNTATTADEQMEFTFMVANWNNIGDCIL